MATAVASPNGSKATEAQVTIDRLPQRTMLVPILGVTPMLMHRFSEKAKRKMLEAAQGKRSPKEPKDPEAEYEAAFYRLDPKDGNDTRYGMPADAFKQATVGAARFYGNQVRMTELRQFVFIHGEPSQQERRAMVEIVGEPEMQEDVVRVQRGGSDLRYRPVFYPWTAELKVSFFHSCITQESVLSLIDAGGLGVGVGEWRPEKNGTFGTYQIDPDRAVQVI